MAVALKPIGCCVLAACLVCGAGRAEFAPVTVSDVVARVDARLQVGWDAAGVRPAAAADDATFLRRLYLDLNGRIPTPFEAREFLEDERTDKRAALIDRLVRDPRSADHLARVWSALLLPAEAGNFARAAAANQLRVWLRGQFAAGQPYDAIASALVAAPDMGRARPVAVFAPMTAGAGPASFQAGHQNDPAKIASHVSRVFLGVQLQCAECHNHPFAEWKREQFWGMAAFFAGRRDAAAPATAPTAGGIKIPGTEQLIQPTFIDGAPYRATPAGEERPETLLARWMTGTGNPYFARSAVNRIWFHFLGRGLAHPVDSVGAEGDISHPELLDELAREFAAARYDLRWLIRVVTRSRAYQLASTAEPAAAPALDLFALMPLKSLSAEQLFDSLEQAIGRPQPEAATNPFGGLDASEGARAQFAAQFEDLTEDRTDYEASMLQALMLMNGALVHQATTYAESQLLRAVADTPFLSRAERVESLYLATLTRRPTAAELKRVEAYLSAAGKKPAEQAAALGDVLWSLINTAEFILNH